ncbi:MAG: M23 family metallopeptidase [Rhodothermales bacterium]|nr:M23 family metallopeptidase [Rhodothermales bacterium]MBO6779296.1 M23 family metallopeptidase [Rhodothermales bacterium]
MRTAPLMIILALAGAQIASAQRSCVENTVCVFARDGQDEITIWVESRLDEAQRVILMPRLLNLVSDRDLPYSAVYEPGTTTKALTLRRLRQNEYVNYELKYYTLPDYLGEMQCSDETACVLARKMDDKVLFYGMNLTDKVISLQFRPTQFENLYADQALPLWKVVPPADTVLLVETYIPRPMEPHNYRFTYRWYNGAIGERHSLDAAYLLPHAVPERPVRKGRSERADERNGVYWYVPDGARVRASRGGIVLGTHQSRQDTGDVYSVTVQHEDGSQAVYRYLDRVDVAVDSTLSTGAILGHAPQFVMLTVQILKPDLSLASVPIRFHMRDGSVRGLRNGEIY